MSKLANAVTSVLPLPGKAPPRRDGTWNEEQPEQPLRRVQQQRQRMRPQQELTRPGSASDLLPGLFGRAAGSLFDMAIGSEVWGWLGTVLQ